MTDEELLKNAIHGDEESFRELYVKYRDMLYRTAFSLLGTAAAAEDAVHDCFIAMLNAGNNFDSNSGTVKAYLFGIIRHLVFRQLRNAGRELSVPLEEFPAFSAPQPDPLHCVLHAERRRLLQAAILRLSAPQRQVLVLFEYRALTLVTISNLIGVDVGAVKARLHRARRNLQKWTERLVGSGYEW